MCEILRFVESGVESAVDSAKLPFWVDWSWSREEDSTFGESQK